MQKAALPEPKLPEHDPDPSADDDESGDFGELLPDLEEKAEHDPDDDRPLFDEAEELDELLDAESANDDAPVELDLGPDSLTTDESARDAGDAIGLDDGALPDELLPEDTLPSDKEERDGIDDQKPLVNDLDLPGLDADDGGGEDLVRFGTLIAATEAELETAPRPWQLLRLSPERERCRSLALDGRSVVAASTDLLWLEAGHTSPVRVALEGTRILSLALVGERRETALCVTAAGRLVRRSRSASDAERLPAHGRLAELLVSELERVELCQLGLTTPESVLGRTGSGLLFRSDDAGTTLRLIEPALSVRALSPTGSPVVALGSDGAGLLVSSDGGATFERVTLDAAGRRLAGGEEPGIASSGGTVVLHDPERGAAVSLDGGRTFREVSGASSVSAVTIGTFDGRPTVWLALYTELADKTRFVRVDPETLRAEVIATLDSTGDSDADLGASARVERLGWDGTRLFAAGDAGFFVLTPEAGDAVKSLHH
jgi:hypothetical protein